MRAMRDFFARALFCVETRFVATRRRQRLYERRIVRVRASAPDVAYRKAVRLCRKDQWVAKRAVSDIALQSQSFIGIGDVLDVEDIREPETIWFEYLDEDDAAPDLRSIRAWQRGQQKGRSK